VQNFVLIRRECVPRTSVESVTCIPSAVTEYGPAAQRGRFAMLWPVAMDARLASRLIYPERSGLLCQLDDVAVKVEVTSR
jgi:hypothetical protein